MLHPHVTESLAATGTPNNILTRTAYRTIYTTLYIAVKTTAFVIRKDPLELLYAAGDKLDADLRPASVK